MSVDGQCWPAKIGTIAKDLGLNRQKKFRTKLAQLQ